jgi:hypothetical protein
MELSPKGKGNCVLHGASDSDVQGNAWLSPLLCVVLHGGPVRDEPQEGSNVRTDLRSCIDMPAWLKVECAEGVLTAGPRMQHGLLSWECVVNSGKEEVVRHTCSKNGQENDSIVWGNW